MPEDTPYSDLLVLFFGNGYKSNLYKLVKAKEGAEGFSDNNFKATESMDQWDHIRDEIIQAQRESLTAVESNPS